MSRYHSFAGGMFLLGRMVSLTTQSLSTEQDAKDVESFFKENGSRGIERSVQQSVETIRANAALYEAHKDDLAKYIKAKKF